MKVLKLPHLHITEASLLAAVSQVVAFVVGFGVINSTQAGVVISAATAVVSAAFLVANALHTLAAK